MQRMDKSVKKTSASRQSDPAINYIVHANWFQFAPGERIYNPQVASRMLLWCAAGGGTITVNGESFPLGGDTWFLLPWHRELIYQAHEKQPFRLGGIHLIAHRDPRRPLVSDVAHRPEEPLAGHAWRTDIDWKGPSGVIHDLFQPEDKMRLLMTYIVESHQTGPTDAPDSAALAALLLRDLLARLRARTSSQAIPGELFRMQEYIRSHLDRSITVAEMAKIFGLSVATLERLFRRYTGHPPSGWIGRARCEKAKRLLRTTTLSVAEVGALVGLPDPFHFSRFFKRIEGLPPAHYQRSQRFL